MSQDEEVLSRTYQKLQREHDKLKRLLHGRANSSSALRSYTRQDSDAAPAAVDWSGHSAFLLTATDPEDAMFDSLGHIAIFCQMREGGGDFDDCEIDQVLAAVERVRTDLDDRCKLIRALITFTDSEEANRKSAKSAAHASASEAALSRHQAMSHGKLRKDCMSLLTDGRRGARLFTVLDNVTVCCARHGHLLDQIAVVPQSQANSSPRTTAALSSQNYQQVANMEAESGQIFEEQVIRLGNGVLATVMVEVPLSDLDVETEAQRARELQEIVSSMRELGELQELLAVESQRQGMDLEHSEEQVHHAYALAAAARQHLTKAAKYRVVFLTLAGGLLGAAIGGPVGLAVGAKSAAAIAGASAIGGVSTAVAANAASTFNNVQVDEEYEHQRLEACH